MTRLARLTVGVAVLLCNPCQIRHPVFPQQPPGPPPAPFPAARFHAVYTPKHYQPYALYAEDVGREPGHWSWLGETKTGRPAWLTGWTTSSGVRVMAAYEYQPHHWRVWFGKVEPNSPDALISKYRSYLSAI